MTLGTFIAVSLGKAVMRQGGHYSTALDVQCQCLLEWITRRETSMYVAPIDLVKGLTVDLWEAIDKWVGQKRRERKYGSG